MCHRIWQFPVWEVLFLCRVEEIMLVQGKIWVGIPALKDLENDSQWGLLWAFITFLLSIPTATILETLSSKSSLLWQSEANKQVPWANFSVHWGRISVVAFLSYHIYYIFVYSKYEYSFLKVVSVEEYQHFYTQSFMKQRPLLIAILYHYLVIIKLNVPCEPNLNNPHSDFIINGNWVLSELHVLKYYSRTTTTGK